MQITKTDLALAFRAADAFRDKRAVRDDWKNERGPNGGTRRVLVQRAKLAPYFALAETESDGRTLVLRAASRCGRVVVRLEGDGIVDLTEPRLVNPETFRNALDASNDSQIELGYSKGVESFVVRGGQTGATTRIATRPLDAAFPRQSAAFSDAASWFRSDGPRLWKAVDDVKSCVGDAESFGQSPGIVVDFSQVVAMGASRSAASIAVFGPDDAKRAAAPTVAIDRVFLKAARSLLADANDIDAALCDFGLAIRGNVGRVSVTAGGSIFEQTPDWRNIAALKPTTPVATAFATAGQALAAIRQADVLSDAESRGVQLTFEPSDAGGGTMIASARSEYGRADVRTPIEFRGERIAEWIEASRMIDFLTTLEPSALVEFLLARQPRPLLFLSSGDRSFASGVLGREYRI